MPRYGEVPIENPLLGEIKALKAGLFYNFKLYPQLWSSPELTQYYTGRDWNIVKFTDPPPPLPRSSAIYMFVVGPYCGGLKDHSYIFYVGKAENLKKRYPEYLLEKAGKGKDPRKEVVLFLNDFENYIDFHYTLVPKAELIQAEALLKDNLTPVANTQLDLIGRLNK
jgi:hypothetical protein